jgi:MiaB-like tRNA modifying enzyme
VFRQVSHYRSAGKKVVLTGCLPKIDPDSLLANGQNIAISPDSINLINQAIKCAVKDFPFNPLPQNLDKAGLRNPDGGVVFPIPIAEGCLGECSYCATRHSRGRLRSFSPKSITSSARCAIQTGCRELRLTAQDTGVFGKDLGSSLAELVGEICRIEGEFRVRIGMMNPSSISKNTSDLIEAYENEKVYRFLHIPLQSGDDEILSDMGRGYRVENFKRIVEEFRKRIPDLTLSTDVIVGYPLEDEASFSKTYRVIEKIQPDILNITRFSPRPNTHASTLCDMPDWIKKERSRKLSSLARQISTEHNKNYVGRVESVLITGIGKNNSLLGRTDSYRQVVLKSGRIGEFKKVKIKDSRAHYLIA